MSERVYKDAVITSTVVELSLADRFRVLFGRKIVLGVVTKTENVVGHTMNVESTVFIEKPVRRMFIGFNGVGICDTSDDIEVKRKEQP